MGCDVLSWVWLGKTRTGRLWTYLTDERAMAGRVNRPRRLGPLQLLATPAHTSNNHAWSLIPTGWKSVGRSQLKDENKDDDVEL